MIIRIRASFTFLGFLLITAGTYKNQKKNDSYSLQNIRFTSNRQTLIVSRTT